MATTTNYGWTTPDDTSLVKDGAAAIRTLGSSVDTTTKALNPSTTLGDIEYRSSTANTNTRLGIGTTGQVLTVSGGVPSWSTPAGGGANFTLLSTTTLSGSTTTVSGISGQNTLHVVVINAVISNTNTQMRFRLNGDTGANYRFQDTRITGDTSYSAAMFQNNYGDSTFIDLARNGTEAAGVLVGGFTVFGANAAGNKPFIHSGGGRAAGLAGARHHNGNGVYMGTSTISSVSIVAEAGTFSGGTVYVYGSAN
jgi:hypothetical protein